MGSRKKRRCKLHKRRRHKSDHNSDVHKVFLSKGSRTPIPLDDLGMLQPGDHIAWKRPCCIFHHAIVVETDSCLGTISVTHFQKEQSKFQILKHRVNMKEEKGQCFRFDYSTDVICKNPVRIVLKRARSMLGKKGFRFFGNNCEHFATYCKTGRMACAQNRWAVGKIMEAATACAANCSEVQVMNVHTGCETALFTSMAGCTGKVTAVEGIELIGKACKAQTWRAPVLMTLFEICHCLWDMYCLVQNRKCGKMTEEDLRISAMERFFEMVCGSCLAIAGSTISGLVGTSVAGVEICTSVIILGSVHVIGGVAGSVCGKVVGHMIGHWLGKIMWKY